MVHQWDDLPKTNLVIERVGVLILIEQIIGLAKLDLESISGSRVFVGKRKRCFLINKLLAFYPFLLSCSRMLSLISPKKNTEYPFEVSVFSITSALQFSMRLGNGSDLSGSSWHGESVAWRNGEIDPLI